MNTKKEFLNNANTSPSDPDGDISFNGGSKIRSKSDLLNSYNPSQREEDVDLFNIGKALKSKEDYMSNQNNGDIDELDIFQKVETKDKEEKEEEKVFKEFIPLSKTKKKPDVDTNDNIKEKETEEEKVVETEISTKDNTIEEQTNDNTKSIEKKVVKEEKEVKKVKEKENSVNVDTLLNSLAIKLINKAREESVTIYQFSEEELIPIWDYILRRIS